MPRLLVHDYTLACCDNMPHVFTTPAVVWRPLWGAPPLGAPPPCQQHAPPVCSCQVHAPPDHSSPGRIFTSKMRQLLTACPVSVFPLPPFATLCQQHAAAFMSAYCQPHASACPDHSHIMPAYCHTFTTCPCMGSGLSCAAVCALM